MSCRLVLVPIQSVESEGKKKTMTAARLLEEALRLSEKERAEVAAKLLESLDFSKSLKLGARTPGEILADVAALPMEDGGRDFSGRDHDAILYGDKQVP